VSKTASALLVALLAVAVYLPSVFAGTFLQYDDDHYVMHSAAVHHFEIKRAFNPWASRADLGEEYLPVRDLTYMIDARIWGLDSPNSSKGFRFTSLIIYAVACALAYLVLVEITGKPPLAFLAAALFAVHPVHAESVAWIASRKDVLSGALGFGALLAHARRHLLLGLVLGAAAILSKSTLVCLPFLIPFVEKRVSWRVLPYFGVAGVLAMNAVNVGTRTGIAHAMPQGGLATVFAWDAPILVRYVAESFVPLGLRVSYYTTFAPYTLPSTTLALGTTLALIVIAGALLLRPETRTGALWFALALAPVLNLKPGVQWIADRYLFLPLLGACLVIARVLQRLVGWNRRSGVALAGLLLLIFASLGVERGLDFATDERLFSSNVAVEPGNGIAHHQLARGRLALAENTIDLNKRSELAGKAVTEEDAALKIFMERQDVSPILVIEVRHSLARALELAGNPLEAADTERQTCIILLKLGDPDARQKAEVLGARLHPFQRLPNEADIVIEAARCFAFAHRDDLAKLALEKARHDAPDLAERAIQEDAELERVSRQ
jgi:hypothetical protein